MLLRTIAVACLAAVLATGTVAAQTKPATTGAAAPVATSTIKPAAAALPAGTKVNLNTATADQLDALPQVGKARAKAILDERAKGSFKDWADFDKRMAHTSVNTGVKNKIKDLVSF